MALSPDETRRYARHLVLRDLGGAGQQKLKAARVLVIGAGGLGSPVIAYLAAAGVGTLGVVDDDSVALSNLQRQIVHRTDAIGAGKAESASAFVAALNPHVAFVAHPVRLDADNAGALFRNHDVVVDGSDSFETRRVVAGAAERARLPLVSGAVMAWDGQVTVFPPGGRRFTDLYPVAPDEADTPTCEMVGVLGAVTGVIGTLMAVEAVKIITGVGTPLSGRLLLYSGRDGRFTDVDF